MKLLALSLTLLVPAAFGADSAPDLQRKFVGSWKLISIEGPNQTSNARPFGMIMYDSPGQIGQDNIRYFELQGKRLTLSVANDGKGGQFARKDTTTHLTWERIPA